MADVTVDARVVEGIDASRRAAWAKFYAMERQAEEAFDEGYWAGWHDCEVAAAWKLVPGGEPRPRAWPVCGVCGESFVYSKRPAGPGNDWAWRKLCDCPKAPPATGYES